MTRPLAFDGWMQPSHRYRSRVPFRADDEIASIRPSPPPLSTVATRAVAVLRNVRVTQHDIHLGHHDARS